MEYQDDGSFIVGGHNYGPGSSREHAALAPRYLGIKVVIAKSFARIHWQNLVNFGILPLTFINPDDWEKIDHRDMLAISDIRNSLYNDKVTKVVNTTKNETYETKHSLSERQVEMILAGSLINLIRQEM